MKVESLFVKTDRVLSLGDRVKELDSEMYEQVALKMVRSITGTIEEDNTTRVSCLKKGEKYSMNTRGPLPLLYQDPNESTFVMRKIFKDDVIKDDILVIKDIENNSEYCVAECAHGKSKFYVVQPKGHYQDMVFFNGRGTLVGVTKDSFKHNGSRFLLVVKECTKKEVIAAIMTAYLSDF